MLKKNKLVASHWLIAGDAYPGFSTEASPFDFRERAEIAGRLGFTGMGFVHQELTALRDRYGYATTYSILQDNGLETIEVEILSDWFATGERRAASDAMRADLLDASDALRAHHLKVSGDMTGAEWPLDRLASSFAELCRDFGETGAKVGIEMMPWSNLSTIRNTMPVVEEAGATNGGLLIDIWHMVRGGVDFGEIGTLPRKAIVSVEINDGPQKPLEDAWEETLHHRLLPGEGTFDVASFLAEIEKTGYDGPVGIEMLSALHRKLPLQEAVETGYAAASRYFE